MRGPVDEAAHAPDVVVPIPDPGSTDAAPPDSPLAPPRPDRPRALEALDFEWRHSLEDPRDGGGDAPAPEGSVPDLPPAGDPEEAPVRMAAAGLGGAAVAVALLGACCGGRDRRPWIRRPRSQAPGRGTTPAGSAAGPR